MSSVPPNTTIVTPTYNSQSAVFVAIKNGVLTVGDQAQQYLLSFQTCKEGDVQSLFSGAGFVTCNGQGQWKGQCLPNGGKGDLNPPLVVLDTVSKTAKSCGADYLYHEIISVDPTVTDLYLQFYHSEVQIQQLNQKYGMSLSNSQYSFWTTNALDVVDQVCQSTPPGTCQNLNLQTILVNLGGPFAAGGLGGATVSYYSGPIGSVVPIMVGATTNKMDKKALFSLLLHELTHGKDQQTNYPSSGADFAKALSDSNVVITTDVNSTTSQGKPALPGGSYAYCTQNKTEAYACFGADYCIQPEVMQKNYPALYQYFKDKVYGQNCYSAEKTYNSL